MNVRGGGHGVWTFEDGTLSFLRILKGGAIRWNVVFERDGGALKCKAAENLVREEGVRGIITQSALDDVPMVILSAKQISSTCRVTKQVRPAAQ